MLKDDTACDSGDGTLPWDSPTRTSSSSLGCIRSSTRSLKAATPVRDKTMDALRVDFDEEELVRVYNNGKGIPVEMHKGEGVHVQTHF